MLTSGTSFKIPSAILLRKEGADASPNGSLVEIEQSFVSVDDENLHCDSLLRNI